MASVYDVLVWAKSNGEHNVTDRIRLKVLPLSVQEKIMFNAINNSTQCSPAYLAAVKKAASEAVGKPCPL